MSRILLGELARFVIVGSIGFAVDGGLLYLLVLSGTDPYLARGLSFPPAVTVTWYLNRVWTFGAEAAAPRRQYARYVGVQIFGALANYALYVAIIQVVHRTAGGALVAFAAGSAAGLLINFFGARTLVFFSGGRSRVSAE